MIISLRACRARARMVETRRCRYPFEGLGSRVSRDANGIAPELATVARGGHAAPASADSPKLSTPCSIDVSRPASALLDADAAPTLVMPRRLLAAIAWGAVALLGALAFGTIALSRGETINSIWLLTAAVCTYVIGYRFYSLFIARRVFQLDNRRATPAERLSNERDFVPTNRWVLFGHHFAAIAGAGPLVGPTLAAQFGYLPGTIW